MTMSLHILQSCPCLDKFNFEEKYYSEILFCFCCFLLMFFLVFQWFLLRFLRVLLTLTINLQRFRSNWYSDRCNKMPALVIVRAVSQPSLAQCPISIPHFQWVYKWAIELEQLMVLWLNTRSKSTLMTICLSFFIVDFERASACIAYILNTPLHDHQVNSNASTRYYHHFNKKFYFVLYFPQNIPANRYEIHCVTNDRRSSSTQQYHNQQCYPSWFQ